MSKIEQKLNQILEEEIIKFRKDEKFIELEKANKEFLKLIEKGLTSSRGNNQFPLEKFHLRSYSFNTTL